VTEPLETLIANQVRPWIPQTEAFIAHMKALLSQDDPQAEQPS
jgi:hypothetical protein